MFVPNFKILGAVPEKSLTQISLCITLEQEMEKRKKTKSKKISALWFAFTRYFNPLFVYKKFEDWLS